MFSRVLIIEVRLLSKQLTLWQVSEFFRFPMPNEESVEGDTC